MPVPALLISLAALVPLIGFFVLSAFGRAMGARAAGVVSTAVAFASLGCAQAAMVTWLLNEGAWGTPIAPIEVSYPWLGHALPRLGILVDGLGLVAASTAATVVTLVQLWAIGIAKRDPLGYAGLSLALSGAIAVTFAPSPLQAGMAATIAGLAALLLTRKTQVLMVDRVADVLLLIGAVLAASRFDDNSWTAVAGMTVPAVLILLAGAARCAQFPAINMAAELAETRGAATAVLSAAVMPTAGVLVVARLCEDGSPNLQLLAAILGALTVVTASACATVAADGRRAVLLCAAAGYGQVLLSLGLGLQIEAATLTIIIASSLAVLVPAAFITRRSMTRGNGLFGPMPVTAIACALVIIMLAGSIGKGVLAASHELGQSLEDRTPLAWALFGAAAAGQLLVPLALSRWWTLTFWGRLRERFPAGASIENATSRLAMALLCGATILAATGLLPVAEVVGASVSVQRVGEAVIAVQAAGAAIGLLSGFVLYAREPVIPHLLARVWPLNWLHAWLSELMFLPILERKVIGGVWLIASDAARWIERLVVRS